MKRIFYFLFIAGLLSVLLSGLVGCGGKTEFSFSTARISDATMATSLDKDMLPVNATDEFSPDTAKICLSVKLSNAPPDTEVKAEWIYVRGEMEDLENYLIDTVSVQGENDAYVGFTLSRPDNGWPKGEYEVVLSIDGKKKLTVPFEVTGGNSTAVFPQSQPQSSSPATNPPSSSPATSPPSSSPSVLGSWVYQIKYASETATQLVFEPSRVLIDGQPFEYTISSNTIRIGQDSYVYTLSGDELILTHTDGTSFQFRRAQSSGSTGGATGGTATMGNEWMLKGTLCTWGGSSGGGSSYSRTAWAEFDGQGGFTYGSESSFSGGGGQAYGGSGTNTGTYRIVGDQIQLSFSDGSSDVARVGRRESDGSITAFYYGEDLYGPELCE
jgi:hypothetical protein